MSDLVQSADTGVIHLPTCHVARRRQALSPGWIRPWPIQRALFVGYDRPCGRCLPKGLPTDTEDPE